MHLGPVLESELRQKWYVKGMHLVSSENFGGEGGVSRVNCQAH